eukprot:scaffold2548_cov121-Isochrysis_galbana.AAC.1
MLWTNLGGHDHRGDPLRWHGRVLGSKRHVPVPPDTTGRGRWRRGSRLTTTAAWTALAIGADSRLRAWGPGEGDARRRRRLRRDNDRGRGYYYTYIRTHNTRNTQGTFTPSTFYDRPADRPRPRVRCMLSSKSK